MNTKVHFSSAKSDWETPQALFEELDAKWGPLSIDACARPDNAKCSEYFTPEQNGLEQEWWGSVWCNPPYGREIGKWVKKAAESVAKYPACRVVMLIPARTDTKWWHDYIWDRKGNGPRCGVEVCFLKGRVKFVGAKDSAPFPSAVVVFGT